jgi:maltooligosyltrehalose trehalohydrolase
MTALAPLAIPSPARESARRRCPVGAEALGDQATHFRLWAPGRRKVELILEDPAWTLELKPEGDGYFSRLVETGPGARYQYRLDESDRLCPDPASRFQPDGPFGPSEVIEARSFGWTDDGWRGVNPRRAVVYEMHVGTFTPRGTWRAAIEQLPRLADLGVNVLEVMPVAEFPGRFGWGYDGVNLFAPTRLYGRPDDFRAFVDRAHRLGLGVILDVVYNHLGPDGNLLEHVTPSYFSTKYETEWGKAINFDGDDSGPVREFFLANAAYWIEEFHLDGLRLDATQSIFDDGEDHVLAAISRVTREAAGKRSVVLIGENEPQQTRLVRPAEHGGYGLDMLWNDDFHHSARVALTGRHEAYYSDHRGTPQEFISAAKYGYLFQGQYYGWQKKARGTPGLDLPPWAFVNFLDNHDQVANSPLGLRSHAITSPGRFRAMTALLLLSPGTPMLFQGQEFASSAPFYYFADHKPDLAEQVRGGRLEFMSQFPSLASPETRPAVPDPHDEATFARCRLDPEEAKRNGWAVELHRDLLRLRRDDPTFSHPRERGVDGAVLGPEAFVLRYFGDGPGLDRLLLVNLGVNLDLRPMPEPLLAPPAGHGWRVAWSSEEPRYGGGGVPPASLEEGWHVAGQAAMVLAPQPK